MKDKPVAKRYETPMYDRLHDQAARAGKHLRLGAKDGRLVRLSVCRDDKISRSVSMTHPRPLTVEQAARELLG